MTEKKYKVLGVGSPLLDTLARVEDTFLGKISGSKGGMELVSHDEQKAIIEKLEVPTEEAAGGAAANTISALGRLGVPVSFHGVVGNDVAADLFTAAFRNAGVHTGHLVVGTEPNGRCLSLVTPDSERTLRTCLGAAATFSPEKVKPEPFQESTTTYLEGYLLFNPPLIEKLLEVASASDTEVMMDLPSFEFVENFREKLMAMIPGKVDVLLANREEAEALFPESKGSPHALIEAMLKLSPMVALKDGAKGAWVATRESDPELAAANPVSSVLDTTGAGDFWASGFLYGRIQGWDLATAAKAGCLLGGEVVQQIGPRLPEERWEAVRATLKTF